MRPETINYPIETILKIYETLRPHYEPNWLIHEIVAHIMRGGIHSEEDEEGRPIAVAFAWHIGDPYDLQQHNFGYHGEDPHGKYLYLPLLFIKEEHRAVGFLRHFLNKLLAAHANAQRILFVRPAPRRRRLHVLTKVNHNGRIATATTLRA